MLICNHDGSDDPLTNDVDKLQTCFDAILFRRAICCNCHHVLQMRASKLLIGYPDAKLVNWCTEMEDTFVLCECGQSTVHSVHVGPCQRPHATTI